ncbi:MAG: hypothetical protein IJT73_02255 [Selenomonadaceae bacterium]|nr:hypothetical protein [Selenomonadaceae bacterium]
MYLQKILLSIAIIGSIFFTATAHAYDLPKIQPDKEDSTTTPIAVSDWTSAELFEQNIKNLLAKNENLPASSPARITKDKNLIFVAFYKGNAYFLDRYSLKVKKDTNKVKSWKQHIFPIGKGISPKNSAYTQQRFCLQDKTFYNSLRQTNKISAAPTDEDKKFLAECFKVGYYYAFKKEIDVKY